MRAGYGPAHPESMAAMRPENPASHVVRISVLSGDVQMISFRTASITVLGLLSFAAAAAPGLARGHGTGPTPLPYSYTTPSYGYKPPAYSYSPPGAVTPAP
jgi:hypothetical protein